MKLGVDQHRGSNFFKPYFRFKKIMMIVLLIPAGVAVVPVGSWGHVEFFHF